MEKKTAVLALLILLSASLSMGAQASKFYDVKWSYNDTSKAKVVAAYADDINGDGFKDIIAASNMGTLVGSTGWVFLLNAGGDLQWRETTEGEVAALAVTDLEGDGRKEAIAGVSSGLFYYDRDGNVSKKYLDVAYKAESIISADINSDGKKELVIPATSSDGGKVYAFDAGKKTLWETKETTGRLTCSHISDLDGNGQKETMVGTVGRWDVYPGYVHLYTSEGKERWVVQIKDGGVYSLSSYDLDKDGREEILVGSNSFFHVLDQEGKIKNSINLSERVTGILVTDLENDGKKEILLGTTREMYVLNENLEKKWATSFTGYDIQDIKVFDINDDGFMEVIVASKFLFFYDKEGKEVDRYPAQKQVGDDPFFARTVELSDLTGDGYPELIVASLDAKVYVLWSQVQAKKMEASRLLQKAAGLLERKNYTGAEEYARESKKIYTDMKDSVGAEKANKFLSDIINEQETSSEMKKDAQTFYDLAYEAYLASDYINATTHARQAKAIYQNPELNDADGWNNCNQIINGSLEYLRASADEELAKAEKAAAERDYQNALASAEKSLEYYAFLKDDEDSARSQAIIDESSKALGISTTNGPALPALDQSLILIAVLAVSVTAVAVIALKAWDSKRKKPRLTGRKTEIKLVEETRNEEKRPERRKMPFSLTEEKGREQVLGVMDDIDRDEKKFRQRRPLAKITKDTYRGLGLSLRGLMPEGAPKEESVEHKHKEKEEDISD